MVGPTREAVLQMLLNVNPRKSPGPDPISNSCLLCYAEQITDYLTALFDASLKFGEMQDEWRITRVVPNLKQGDPHSFSNYRHVSITSSCCKILEHIVANHVNTILFKNNIVPSYQHGYRINV